MPIRRFFIRAPNWIGDAVMAVPSLQQLKAFHPDASITILARPWVADLYRREPFCDELIPFTAKQGWSDLDGKWRLARELRRRQFDCAVLLQNAFEAAVLARLARTPVRVGYDRDARGWLLTHPILVPKAGETPKHQRFYYLELLKRARLIADYSHETNIRLQGASAAALAGREQFAAAGLRGMVVGISPGAAYGGAKRWLPERFAEAAVQVARHLKADVAVFGSKAETPICTTVTDAVAAQGLRALNFSGSIPLGVFVELTAACSVMLTNDSGPMHIASALGVPTVAIFGATDDIATGPTGEQSAVVREAVECSPCLLRECPIDHRCMTRVTAGSVAGQALALLAGSGTAKR